MIPAIFRYLLPLLATLLGLQPYPVLSADDPGRSVVLRLQQRYDDIRPECPDGGPAANCNGVVIRAIREPSNPTFWNPSQTGIDRDGVSFSYIRKDVGSELLPGNAGLIMRELGAPSQQPLRMRCVFPSNANTAMRADSCGTEAFPLPCHLSGVTDIPTWQAHFAEQGPTKTCHFTPTAYWFQFNVEVRKHYPDPDSRRYWNELVFAAWPPDIPEKLPIEALYFSGDGLADAQLMQENYIHATGLFLPIVRVELTRDRVFYYSPKDQSQLAQKTTWPSDSEQVTEPLN
ncbi:hypothetical protein ACX3YG_29240 [Pseudomonas wadenswilerensis]